MANPQQPEVRRSEKNPALSPDAIRARLEAQRNDRETAELLVEGLDATNGHTQAEPGQQQDQPDPDDFAQAFGVTKDES